MPPPEPVRSEDRLALTILYHPDVTRVGEQTIVDGDFELSRTSPLFGCCTSFANGASGHRTRD